MRVATSVLPLLAALPATLAAQARVGGVVHDSLTGRPFAGATVQLVQRAAPGAPARTVAADSAGRYDIPDVPPGQYLLGFLHPRLDWLGMEVPARTLDVPPQPSELVADLALPSAHTIARSLCGVRRDSTGVLLGRVLEGEQGQTVGVGSVLVRWGEVHVDRRGVRRVRPSVRAAVGDGGRYVACGVPTDAPVLVQATAGHTTAGAAPTAASGEIAVAFAPGTPVLHRDLLVAAAPAGRRGTARLVGRVVRPDGRPAAGARVVVRDARAADSLTVTGDDGTFRLEALPAGTYAVEAFALGFTPARGAADLRPGHPATLELALGARTLTLDAVAVYAPPSAMNEFARRKRRGGGYYMTAEQIEKRGARTLADALLAAPMLRVSYDARGRLAIRGRGLCVPDVYMDGVQVRDDGSTDLDAIVPISQLEAIEVYDSAAGKPSQYGDGSCASVVLWTKGALR